LPHLVLVLATLAAPLAVIAQPVGDGRVTTAPLAVAPAMGMPSLLLLAVVLVGIAAYFLRRVVGRDIAVVGSVAVLTALAGLGYAFTNMIMVQGAQCGIATTQMFNPLNPNTLISDCKNLIQIISLQPGTSCQLLVGSDPCRVGQVLANNDACMLPNCTDIQVTFQVKVPPFTPPTDKVYISGHALGVLPDPLCTYCGGVTPGTQMTETAPGSHIWQITLPIPDGASIEYKYTRGSYDSVEEWGSLLGPINRVATVAAASPTNLTQLFDDTSDTNPDDNHRAVQNWRDALVTSTVPAGGASGTAPAAITAYFNWDVKPDGADFSNAILVERNGTAVADAIIHDSTTQSLTFTPASPLTTGTYTVTIDHVVSLTVQNDGIKILTPYVFTFNVS